MTGKNNYTQVQSKKVLTDFSKCFSTLQKKKMGSENGVHNLYILKKYSVFQNLTDFYI